MNCTEVQSLFGSYWDLPHDNDCRAEMDEHMKYCEKCAEEFRIWEESERLIRDFSDDNYIIGPLDHVNRSVMDRIFKEQSWMAPVAGKSYSFTKQFRRNLALIIAGGMAVFGCSLFVLLFQQRKHTGGTDIQMMSGLMDTGIASDEKATFTTSFYSEVPIASISDPLVLKIVPTFPQYYVALSLLGLVAALLMLNWLSRTRS